jgi:hypothetical protein
MLESNCRAVCLHVCLKINGQLKTSIDRQFWLVMLEQLKFNGEIPTTLIVLDMLQGYGSPLPSLRVALL